MVIAPGTIVRPVVSFAGLDSRRQYTVRHLVSTPFTSVAWVEDSTGALLPPVANAHLVLEPVKGAATIRPAAALFN